MLLRHILLSIILQHEELSALSSVRLERLVNRLATKASVAQRSILHPSMY
jgi:hypothetical protein